MCNIELEVGCEQQVFDVIIDNPEKISILPKGFYEKFLAYMIQEEMYEHIQKLQAVKIKISDKTLYEMI